MGLTEEQILANIKATIEQNKIAVFMKGTPSQPKCGFSATVVDILNRMNVPYVGVDAIEDPRFRHVLSAHTQWPTLPQVFVDGKLIGGCDIVREMKATGELDRVVAEALA
jgi:monothiol glutaredoxin